MDTEERTDICKSCGKNIGVSEKATIVEGGLLCFQCEQNLHETNKTNNHLKKEHMIISKYRNTKISKKLFLSVVISRIVSGLMFLLAIFGAAVDVLSYLLSFLYTAVMVYSVVCELIIWYKAWASIQDGNARTTPGKAIGFMFIPIFNFYWFFQAIWGFAKDYNNYIERHKYNAEKLPDNFFLSFSFMIVVVPLFMKVLSFFIVSVPFLLGILEVSIFLSIIVLIFWFFVITMVYTAANTISTSPLSVEKVEEQSKV